jgi:hypothetical protein
MPAILDFLYEEYCRARLAEMRKQLLLKPQHVETSELGSDDRATSDDRVAGRYQAQLN